MTNSTLKESVANYNVKHSMPYISRDVQVMTDKLAANENSPGWVLWRTYRFWLWSFICHIWVSSTPSLWNASKCTTITLTLDVEVSKHNSTPIYMGYEDWLLIPPRKLCSLPQICPVGTVPPSITTVGWTVFPPVRPSYWHWQRHWRTLHL